jgi:hypothetical protein
LRPHFAKNCCQIANHPLRTSVQQDEIEIVVTTVRELESDARINHICGRSRQNDLRGIISSGWLATLARKKAAIHVQVSNDGAELSNKAIDIIKRSWKDYDDMAAPISLTFPSLEEFIPRMLNTLVNFHICVTNGLVEVRNSRNQSIDFLPELTIMRSVLRK